MAAKPESGEKSNNGLMPFVIAAVLTSLAGLGFGYGVTVVFVPDNVDTKAESSLPAPAETGELPTEKPKEKHGDQSAEASAEEEPEAEVIDPATVAYTQIPDVVTNLSEPRKVWIRLEAGIAFVSTGEKKPDILAAETSHQIGQYLRTLSLRDIEGPDSFQYLQDDLNKITNTLSNGQVQKVLISGLVVE